MGGANGCGDGVGVVIRNGEVGGANGCGDGVGVVIRNGEVGWDKGRGKPGGGNSCLEGEICSLL